MDWFLYDNGLRHERANILLLHQKQKWKWWKHKIFDEKQKQKKYEESASKNKITFSTVNSPNPSVI